jgi:hypothetical protein
MQEQELVDLGLTPNNVAAIHMGRVPSPSAAPNKLLIANKWACCVCRNPNLPIIVHHIDE